MTSTEDLTDLQHCHVKFAQVLKPMVVLLRAVFVSFVSS